MIFQIDEDFNYKVVCPICDEKRVEFDYCNEVHRTNRSNSWTDNSILLTCMCCKCLGKLKDNPNESLKDQIKRLRN